MKSVKLSEYIKSHKLSSQDICDYIVCLNNVVNSIDKNKIDDIDLNLDHIYVIGEKPLILKFSVINNLDLDFYFENSKSILRLFRHIDVEDKNAISEAYELFCRTSKDKYTMSGLMAICEKYADINLVNKDLVLEAKKELSSVDRIKDSYKFENLSLKDHINEQNEDIIEYKYKDNIYKIPLGLGTLIYDDFKIRSQIEYITELSNDVKQFSYLKSLNKKQINQFAAESKDLEEIYALEDNLPQEAVLQTIEKFKNREKINKKSFENN